MPKRTLDRREFLKITIASVAAAGLSHFRILNFGGAELVLAAGCGYTVGAEDVCCGVDGPDYCNPGEDKDNCPDPSSTSSDVCVPDMGESDYCEPADGEVDICAPPSEAEDVCTEGDDALCVLSGEPDVCGEGPGVQDVCDPNLAENNPDVCPDEGGDGDICNISAPVSPDECIPALGESDYCPGSAEPDFCRDPDSGVVASDLCNPPDDVDLCFEGGQTAEDICDPGEGNPDDPNSIRLTALDARATSGLALGAAATVLLGAARLLGEKSPPAKDKQA